MACCAHGCHNRSAHKSKGQLHEEKSRRITFHRFPKSMTKKKEWLAAMRKENWKPSKYSVLCSDHFSEKYFDRTSVTCVRLRSDAVPTIFKRNPSYLHKAHFADDQWEVIRQDGKKKLKANAVPTIFEINSKQKPKKDIDSNGKPLCNQSRNSSNKIKKNHLQKIDGSPRVSRKKVLKSSSDEGESDDSLQPQNKTHKYPVVCIVCGNSLLNKPKEYLSTSTKSSGRRIYDHLSDVSTDKAAQLKDFGVNDAVCMTCARLIKFIDRMEADLALLKGAIFGCLQLGVNGTDTKLESHREILEQFNQKILDGHSFSRDPTKEKTLGTGELKVHSNGAVAVGPRSQDCSGEDSVITFENTLESGGNDWRRDIVEESPVYRCQLCKFHSFSRSLLLFHLRRHMADYLWCDYCNDPLKFVLENVEKS